MRDIIQYLFSASSDLVMFMDADGVVLACNESMSRQLGLSVKELVGERIFDFFPYDAARSRKAHLDTVISTGKPSQFEDSLWTPGNTNASGVLEVLLTPVPSDEGGVAGAVLFGRDITEKKRAEKEHFRMITAFEQTVEAVIILEPDFTVSFVNQSFEAMTGYSQSEMRGQSIRKLYRGTNQARQFRVLSEAVQRGEVWTGRTHNTRKDGTLIQCEKTVSPIRGRGGVLMGYVSVWRDVTDLAELERQVRTAQKMEAIGTLAGGIAHDFNNVLGPIMLHSELGLEALADDDPLRESFDEILGAAERAKALVDQILSLGRRREGDEPVPFRLSSIVRECIKLLRPSLPATITIDLLDDTRTGTHGTIMADPTQAHQVVMNLCTNAAHAMREKGGVLGLALAEREIQDSDYRAYPELVAGRYVELAVTDTGPGMTDDFIEKIFDPFFTTKKDGSGSGLGLSVVRNIVTWLGGAVRVESEPGEGSRFRVLLPLAPEWVERDAAVPASVERPRGTERILLADDDRALATSVRMTLETLGYTVTVASDGARALERFSQQPDRFDLVLADVTMPGMTGVDLARELLRLKPSTRILLTSGYTELISPDEARSIGVRGFIKKPCSVDELARSVRAALDGNGANGPSNDQSNKGTGP